MSSSSLPPIGNLPHWPRVVSFDKARYPRPFRPDAPVVDAQRTTVPPGDMDSGPRRVAALERDLQFLQQQHRDTLGKLHVEIEQLKRDNKDLQYKLIMEPKPSRKGSAVSSSAKPSGRRASQQILASSGSCRKTNRPQLLQQQGDSQACKGNFLEQTVHTLDLHSGPPQDLAHSDLEIGTDASSLPAALTHLEPEPQGGLITSLQPLRIHCSSSQPPRAPTLQECEVIIRQLYNANSLQSQELLRMKSVLKDIVINNNKMTPETYILTKAYLTDTTRIDEAARFPKLPLKALPKKLPEAQPTVAERVILPALKQSLGSSFAERQKRAQAVQKSRLRRAVH
ncbi:coiled-coil domain-containing protein 74B isoform X1 [Amia ocellicauda]|uniref:coiled-coil domain-containing protein 74B isoform X1 n=2 Tax=Amia ocellicauda TaxID=2972642 RepID=UPI003463E210